MHLASPSQPGKPTDAKDEAPASKGDDQQGDDDDDDDDDDEEDTAKSSSESAKPAAPVKEVDPHAKERLELQKAVNAAEQELSANLAEQKQLKQNVDHLSDLSSSDHEIDASAQSVAKETESVAMAGMLSKMWKEMRMFEIPAYTKHSEEQMRHLRHKEKRIEDDLTAAEAEVSAAKRRWAGEAGAAKSKKKEERRKEKVALAGDDKDEKPILHKDVEAGVEHAQDKSVEAAVLHRWSIWHMDWAQKKAVFFSSIVYLFFGILLAFAYKEARFKNKQPFQPTPRLELQNQYQRKDFSFSIFGCFADPNVCVVGCCCPVLRWADTVDRKSLLSYWPGFSIMFGLMLLHVYTMGISTFIACIVGVYYRQRLRKKYGFDSGNLMTLAFDIMAWFCCQPCAIIQEAREEAAHEAC